MKRAIIYGVGRTGKLVFSKASEAKIEILAFIDNNVTGKFNNIPILSVNEIPSEISREIPIILALHHDVHTAAKEMKKNGFDNLITLSGFNIHLRKSGFSGIEIIPLADPDLLSRDTAAIKELQSILSDSRSQEIFQHYLNYLENGSLDMLEQHEPGIMYYTDNRPFEFRGKVTMADCGAFIGDSIIPLIGKIDFREIYAFEPDPVLAKELHENLRKHADFPFQIIQAGVGKHDEQLFFQPGGMGGKITETGDLKIDIISLDSIFGNTQIDFIKMDIEGAEESALLGAKEVIKRDTPLLEICVYHRWGDFWNLPLLIKQLHPGYAIYFRCNDDSFHDTVCCAVPERYLKK
ncbi:MAG: FkbM family methyltransferase [Lentisphaeria bacterium]|nr:FkbM family methyltransferase [Lentisphaeria bacterium]